MILTLFQQLQTLELNLDYFYSLNITSSCRLLGNHNNELIKYIEDKGFYKIDYLYKNNDNMFEYKNGNIYITLEK